MIQEIKYIKIRRIWIYSI